MARRSVRVDGRALERLRVARGYGRQSDLAEAAGVSPSTVSRAEAGSTDAMSEESARQLAAALDVAVVALIAAEDDGPPPPADHADAIADRVVDKLAERLPAIVRAILAEQPGQRGQHGGSPVHDATANTESQEEARPVQRPTWRSPAGLTAVAG